MFRLAEDYGIVLLNGGGFEAPDWSVRVSFANLDDHVYDDIGRAVRAIARGYVQAYEASKAALPKQRKAKTVRAPKAAKTRRQKTRPRLKGQGCKNQQSPGAQGLTDYLIPYSRPVGLQYGRVTSEKSQHLP